MSVSIMSFKITGLSPLLMNNPASMAVPSGGLRRKAIPTPAEEALSKRYADDKGFLYIKTISFRSALLGACVGRKLGRIGARRVVSAAVFTVAETADLLDPDTGRRIKDYAVNTTGAVIMKARIWRSRPEVPRWSCRLDLEVDGDFIAKPEPVLELLNVAGKISGVLDWRPERGGQYGRFRAELLDNAVRAKAKAAH